MYHNIQIPKSLERHNLLHARSTLDIMDHGTSEVKYSLSACTVNNSLAKDRRLSLCPSKLIMLYLSLVPPEEQIDQRRCCTLFPLLCLGGWFVGSLVVCVFWA